MILYSCKYHRGNTFKAEYLDLYPFENQDFELNPLERTHLSEFLVERPTIYENNCSEIRIGTVNNLNEMNEIMRKYYYKSELTVKL